MFRPCFTNGHGILKSMDGRSLWIGIAFLEGARLRKKLPFVVRNRVLAEARESARELATHHVRTNANKRHSSAKTRSAPTVT